MAGLRAALCALACAWAGQAWAGSSASAQLVEFRWSVVDLKPDDDVPPVWNGYAREGFSAQVCLAVDGAEECWYDEYNWFGDPQHVARSNASANAAAANAGGNNYDFDPPIRSAAETAFGATITPTSGSASFRAMTSYGYGVGLDPWTEATFEIDVMLHATADAPTDAATAYASLTFLGGFASIAVDPSKQQGLHTLRVVVKNPTDEIDWFGSPFRIELSAQGQSAAPIPEPSTALLLACGLLGLVGWRHVRPAARCARRAATG